VTDAANLRADAAAEINARQQLDELNRRALQELDGLLTAFLDALVDHLLDSSAKAGGQFGYNHHYQAMNLVKRQQGALLATARNYLQTCLVRPPGANGEAGVGDDLAMADGQLDLVDIQDFEDRLAIERAAGIANSRHGPAIEALTLRVAALTGLEPLELRLPVHVAEICRALRYALISSESLDTLVPTTCEFFSDWAQDGLAALYAHLNGFLAEQGLQPDLEQVIAERGSILADLRRKAALSPSPAAPDNRHGAVDNGAGPAINSANTGSTAAVTSAPTAGATAAAFCQSVMEALELQRGERPARTTGATPAAGREGAGKQPENDWQVDTDTLARLLGHLQQSRYARDELESRPSVRDYLNANLDELTGLEGGAVVNPESLNQIDLVDRLFSRLRNELDVTPDLKPALGALQIPLAKLAVLEPNFFFDPEHPGRRVINQLAELTVSANFPNRALTNRVNDVVAGIVETYQTDSNVFSAALEEVDKLLDQQRRAMARNMERVANTQQGRQTLKLAQTEVDKILRSKIRPPSAPGIIVELVANGWRDLLVLTHVKDGPGSKSWHEYIATLDQLLAWLDHDQQDAQGATTRLERELEADTFVDMIAQQINTAMPASVAHEPVLMRLHRILTGQEPATTVAVDYPEEAGENDKRPVSEKVESQPRLRRWLRQVERLQPGSRFFYRDDAGRQRTMQLAWVSHNGDRYIFVNERGQVHADLSNIQLARQLARGMHQPTPADELSPVDKSLYDTLEQVQKTLERSAHRDELTGLLNREGFLNQLEQTAVHARSRGSEHALLVLDIDQFGIANELVDRDAGDAILIELGRLLEGEPGQEGLCARLEQDRFALILFNRSASQAKQHAEHIRTVISSSAIELAGEPIALTASIGITSIGRPYLNADELIDKALTAVATAKRNGRNQSLLAKSNLPGKGGQDADKVYWCKFIEEAMVDNRLILQGQPIVHSARTEHTGFSHYEVLIGLLDEQNNTVSPQELILAAERYGYMTTIDRWVIQRSLDWMRQLIDSDLSLPQLSINISGNSVTDDLFLEFLMEQIDQRGIPHSQLCFEITETGTISNMVKAADFVRTLRDLGCRFSIDDFGTGMASYNYLRELPVDYVKIDGSFITHIQSNPNDYAMTRSINDLAQFLGQETIAECVESEEIAATLRELGVNYLQGWGVGRPRPLATIRAELGDCA
jgi:diguanylate cyclase (GGDEF)-like protein